MNSFFKNLYKEEEKTLRTRVRESVKTKFPEQTAEFARTIGLFYYKTGQKDKADEYLTQAIMDYRKLEKESADNSNSVAHYQKLQNIALMQKGDWEGFLENVDAYYQQEDEVLKRGQWLFLKALITEQRLNDPENAQKIYERFISDFPDHPLASLAKTRQEVLLSPVS